MKARCGGPALCEACRKEAASLNVGPVRVRLRRYRCGKFGSNGPSGRHPDFEALEPLVVSATLAGGETFTTPPLCPHCLLELVAGCSASEIVDE